MSFANNILLSDASRYTLNKASITNGILTIQAGGTVTYKPTSKELVALTNTFRMSFLTDKSLDRYEPVLYAYISTTAADGNEYSVTVTPACDANKVCSIEFELENSSYTDFTLVIHSNEDITFTLWELCPEASDANVDIVMNGVTRALPLLLYDYNMLPLVVSQLESIVGLITFTLSSPSDLQGHFIMSYVASADCVLTLRIKNTGVTELYTPILYDIKAGRGNISIPHAYLELAAGMYTTYITVQVSTGTLAIDTRGILYTIDGGYLASRELDAGVEAFDVTVKQTDVGDEPDEVWIVGVDAGECFVRSRPYSINSATGFTARYSLGEAKTAAIEFNGYWRPNGDIGATKHTLITEEEPYVFWTDADDNLYRQAGQDESTRVLIDTDVSSVSACRGFSSWYKPEQDQGLVALYVKNGVAKYIMYCYVSVGVYEWQGPFTVNTNNEVVVSAYVHRLNDYRLSLAVTTETNNYWYITDRTYVTQASPTEHVSVEASKNRVLTSVLPATYEYDLQCSADLNGNFTHLILTFNHPVRSFGNVDASQFSLVGLSITSMEFTSSNVLDLTLSGPSYFGFTLSYTANKANLDGLLQFAPFNNTWAIVEDFSITVPGYKFIESGAVDVNVNSVVASVSQRGIETVQTLQQDAVSIAYTSAASAVTQYPVSTSRTSQTDSVSIGYSTVTSTATQTQTGSKPI